jgi:hypothetical protein
VSAVQTNSGPPSLAKRADVASRTVAAILGGYVAAALSAMLMALTLPLPKDEAVSLATLLCFVTYACAAIWAFAARTPARACLWLGAAIAVAWALVHLLKGAA